MGRGKAIPKPTKVNRELANKLVRKHQLACKTASHHCIYSNKTYSESCINCFALWILENYKK